MTSWIRMLQSICCTLIFASINDRCHCQPVGVLFPYGNQREDYVISDGDDECHSLYLSQAYQVFGTSIVHVCVDGLVSFGWPVLTPRRQIPGEFGSTPIVAVNWQDYQLNDHYDSRIYYRISYRGFPRLLDSSQVIRSSCGLIEDNDACSFLADWELVVTWVNVVVLKIPYYSPNTFQLIITSNNASVYIILNYLTASDPVGAIGYDAGDGRTFYAMNTQLVNPALGSNIGSPGRWVYRVQAQSFNDTVRLSESGTRGTGRLEVLYRGVWGTVCDDLFTDNAAKVVCHMLGYGYVGRKVDNVFGMATGIIWLDNVVCTGTESSIAQCSHRPWGQNDCTHDEDVAVSCNSNTGNRDIVAARLTGGPSEREGRLEVLYRGQWGTVCDDRFTAATASVVCRMLAFGTTGRQRYNGNYGYASGPIWWTGVRCTGQETNIGLCPHSDWGDVGNCLHADDVAIDCTDQQSNIDNERKTSILKIVIPVSAVGVVVIVVVIIIIVVCCKCKNERRLRQPRVSSNTGQINNAYTTPTPPFELPNISRHVEPSAPPPLYPPNETTYTNTTPMPLSYDGLPSYSEATGQPTTTGPW